MRGLWESGWERKEKLVEKASFAHKGCDVVNFAQKFTRELHGDLHVDFHIISTFWWYWIIFLTINTLLDFFDLVAESKIEFEVFFDFLNTMHNSGVIFDTYFGSDFGSAKA